MTTHYEVLGCDPSSTDEELKAAYHQLAFQHHPDKGGGGGAEAFSRVDEAWKALRSPELRRDYDAALKQLDIEDQSLLFGSYRLHELDYDPAADLYSTACRCGGAYTFTKKDFEEFNSYLVGCELCSLVISVDLQT